MVPPQPQRPPPARRKRLAIRARPPALRAAGSVDRHTAPHPGRGPAHPASEARGPAPRQPAPRPVGAPNSSSGRARRLGTRWAPAQAGVGAAPAPRCRVPGRRAALCAVGPARPLRPPQSPSPARLAPRRPSPSLTPPSSPHCR